MVPATREQLRQTMADGLRRVPRILVGSDAMTVLAAVVKTVQESDAFADSVLTHVQQMTVQGSKPFRYAEESDLNWLRTYGLEE